MLRRIAQLLLPLLLFPAMIFGSPIVAQGSLPTPIRHVVIIDQENHSFDNVLGKLCVQLGRCLGTTTGLLHDGTVLNPLPPATDIVPGVAHEHDDQVTAIDGGKMDGFNLLKYANGDCTVPPTTATSNSTQARFRTLPRLPKTS